MFIVLHAAIEKLCGASYDSQGIADFMGDAGNHFAKRSKPLRLMKLLFELVFLLASCRDYPLGAPGDKQNGHKEDADEEEKTECDYPLKPVYGFIIMTYVLCYFKDAEDLSLSPAKRPFLPHRQIGNKPSGAAFEFEPEKIGLIGRHHRNGFFVQSSIKDSPMSPLVPINSLFVLL